MSSNNTTKPKPVVLMILDGWGAAPPSRSNAITLAKTPGVTGLIKTYPAMTLQASGEAVGLSWGEIGNSEVGHLNLGSGKLVYQNLPRINKSIADGSFFENEKFIDALKHAKKNKGKVHLLGLISSGGVHSYIDHLFALLELCQKEKFREVYIHGILDGRDMPYNSGIDFVDKIKSKTEELGVGRIATLSGRFYAMDRDNHWERVVLAYNAMVKGGAAEKFSDPGEAVRASYGKKIYDEEFVPVVIEDDGQPVAVITPGDAVIFFNFRADRAREISKAFVLPGFEKFERQYLKNLYFVAMTEYEKDVPMEIAFPPETIEKPLAKVIADAGLTQLHIAETEKYAHVTFFFNGGAEQEFSGEDRILVPSPRVASYAEKPEMSAKEVAQKTIDAIMSDKYDFIVLNFANCDMVGHTGDLKATIKAVETVDSCVKKITEVILAKGGVALITADHGNAEELVNLQSGDIDKEHSTYPVPLVIIGKEWEGKNAGFPEVPGGDLSLVQPAGLLSDVAPTIIGIMGLKQPTEMTGKPLI
ncbi:MAG: 2,3-bisphosphoglycerate-independent phosphoglycerate mutase [Candidatus Buchananbacteria bacterium]